MIAILVLFIVIIILFLFSLVSASTGHFQKALLGLSVFALMAQIIFQIVLGALPPYGHFFPNCKLFTVLWLLPILKSYFFKVFFRVDFTFNTHDGYCLVGSTYEQLTRQIGLSR